MKKIAIRFEGYGAGVVARLDLERDDGRRDCFRVDGPTHGEALLTLLLQVQGRGIDIPIEISSPPRHDAYARAISDASNALLDFMVELGLDESSTPEFQALKRARERVLDLNMCGVLPPTKERKSP